ncbi:MAG TPA: helix-turn-helix transcriptional regulator [Bradyrhizobium sp.]|uniref:helix-turn-helix transcriptional regulator n=1 Tax=Bradyrhizobium sp. TaxID=376 RepID=UPI002B610DF1|nr:helix-turn-helix transcriptional regulator [Bradyrhizobium sp.]HLZ01696.1 helix-turn-helix transcriptional regulator [Bradyrhizobium sp.]
MKQPSRDYRQLQQIIVGLTDGVILVGADQKILWANDAALVMHGVRAIKELGATVSQYRKRFRLRYRNNRPVERGRYPIERVVSGESFSDVTVEVTRAGDPEQSWVHSIRSLVITDDSEVPDYLVLIIKDETERFRAEERFESAFNANPAPAIICRVSDQCYVRVNPGFLEMTGYAHKDVLGASFAHIDILSDAEKRDLGIERLREGRTIPQMEARLPLPNGGAKWVIVAGEPIEIGEENCILFTFADLDPRVKAESALRQSEERFAKSFRLSPVPMAIFALSGFKCIEVNETFKAMTNYADEEIVGRSPTDLRLWVDKAAQHHFERTIKETGSVPNVDLQVRAKDDVLVDCLVSAETVTINDESCVLCVMQNITERKRSETELITAIEAVMADTSWFSRTIVEKLAALRQSSQPRSLSADLGDLTSREREVLGLICQGQSDSEMSATLKLSGNTIRNHVSSLYRKIGVKRRAAAVIWARERGITGMDAISPKKPLRGR